MKLQKKMVGGVILLLSLLMVGCGSKEAVSVGAEEETQIGIEETVEQSGSGMSDAESGSVGVKGSEATDGASGTPAGTTQAPPTEAPQGTLDKTSQGESEDGVAGPATCGALWVDGTKLKDKNGNIVQLKGLSTHGLSWFPGYVNEEWFSQLRREWKANVVRLAMYTAENGGYCTGGDKAALKQLVKDGVEYATAQDLYVIIDWHVLNDCNPNLYKEEAKAFFGEMSSLYADYDNVIYEICNEPNGGVSWAEIKSYAEEVIPVIRENDAEGIILVGTPNWSQYVKDAAADPITGYENIMYTLHFYAATHTDWLRNDMKSAVDAGLPVFVSEYGICDASGNGGIDEAQAEEWVALLDEYDISYVAWNLSNKNETSAIFRTDCGKTSGFEQADLSESGQWLYELLTAGEPGERTSSANTQPSSSGIETSKSPAGAGNATSSAKTDGTTPPAETVTMPTTGEGAATSAITGTLENGLTYELELKNSWESGDQSFCQYAITVNNTSGADISDWSIEIPFESEISVSSGWNGNYEVSGHILYVTSVEYNGVIPAGGSVGDVGVILSVRDGE